MFSTLVLVVAFGGLTLLQFVFWIIGLQWGLRWAGIASATFRGAAAVTGIVYFLTLLAFVPYPLAVFRARDSEGSFVLIAWLLLGAQLLIPIVIVKGLFGGSWWRSIQALLPTLLSGVPSILLTLFVIRPFTYEAFVCQANSMAPTLLGKHWSGTCPQCGGSCYCSPRELYGAQTATELMICDKFHVGDVSNFPLEVNTPDRVLTAKFLQPRRWDLVTFRVPEDPAVIYVKRLVGLPGETITIQDGAVWANGNRLQPPDSLSEIQYLAEAPGFFRDTVWGSKDHAAVLGNDEYFVLGDFSKQSRDSRLWSTGAPGHPPYAVPRSHLIGVVTHIYWPPERWKNLR